MPVLSINQMKRNCEQMFSEVGADRMYEDNCAYCGRAYNCPLNDGVATAAGSHADAAAFEQKPQRDLPRFKGAQ
jgi:hypothetical protein